MVKRILIVLLTLIYFYSSGDCFMMYIATPDIPPPPLILRIIGSFSIGIIVGTTFILTLVVICFIIYSMYTYILKGKI